MGMGDENSVMVMYMVEVVYGDKEATNQTKMV